MKVLASSLALTVGLCSVGEGLLVGNLSETDTVQSSSLNKSFQSHLVDGYSDCKQQIPTGPEWWRSKANGHRAASSATDDHGLILRIPSRDAVVCAPRKNGCTYWQSLLMRMDGNHDWNHAEARKRHWGHGLDTKSWHMFDKPQSLTFMLVRNPVVRLLSAFMNLKANGHGYYYNLMKDFSNTPLGFQKFVSWVVASDERNQQLDAHWRKQGELCGLSESARYDFYLKVECRALWSPSLFDQLHLHAFTDSGWGDDGRQPFINSGDGAAKPTVIEGAKWEHKTTNSHTTEASDVAEFCEWYSALTFQKVQTLYYADIHAFDYAEDVRRLGQACGFL